MGVVFEFSKKFWNLYEIHESLRISRASMKFVNEIHEFESFHESVFNIRLGIRNPDTPVFNWHQMQMIGIEMVVKKPETETDKNGMVVRSFT